MRKNIKNRIGKKNRKKKNCLPSRSACTSLPCLAHETRYSREKKCENFPCHAADDFHSFPQRCERCRRGVHSLITVIRQSEFHRQAHRCDLVGSCDFAESDGSTIRSHNYKARGEIIAIIIFVVSRANK